MNWVLPQVDTYFENLLRPDGFEIDHLEEALKYCTKFRTAIDGGAHIGTWACRLARSFDYVLALEPAKDSYDCLLKNVHRLRVPVVCYNAALGEVDGFCKLIDDPIRTGNTGARITFFGQGVIPVCTVDRFCLDTLDFLKLDLEGSETLALRGALRTIDRCKPTIVAECKEFHPPRNGGVAATRKLLHDIGYREVGGIRNDRVFVPK